MKPRTPRILLAGEGRKTAACARTLLKSLPEFKLVGVARNGDDTLALVRTLYPHAVILDITTAIANKLEVMHRIAREAPETRMIVLAEQEDHESVNQALRAGATGFLSGAVNADEIEFAVRAVLCDGVYLSPTVCKAFVTACFKCGRKSQVAATPLTPRQGEVLKLLAEGKGVKQIAALLKISVKTVETHRAHIMGRLAIRDLAGLVRYAMRHGLVHPDV